MGNGVTPETDEHDFQHFGVPPNKQGDYAYMLHIIRSLKSDGRAAVILPHGILFRGNEETIRKNILKRGYIKAIIATCKLVLRNGHSSVYHYTR